MWRVLGVCLIFVALFAGVGEFFRLRFPMVNHVFSLRELPWLGWVLTAGICVIGLGCLVKSLIPGVTHPVTVQKLIGFRRRKAGWYSAVSLVILAVFASLGHLLVGKEALVVHYDGEMTFPAFTMREELGVHYGIDEEAVPNFRELSRNWKNDDREGDWMILPLWPYAVDESLSNDERERAVLGTTSEGVEVIAALYQGLQVNFQAAIVYLPVVTLIGLGFGLIMGYFGGFVDLLLQRVVEVISHVPTFFLALLLVALISEPWRGAFLSVVLVLASVGWVKIASLMRDSTRRERGRQYVSASRVFGASSTRVVVHHLLPNTISAVVSALPMTFGGLVISLTALDFLGFGFSDHYYTWGKLLRDGWLTGDSIPLMTATFITLSLFHLLIIVTGEAIRSSFIPTSVTSYR